ncbi:MAG: hypothetical protein JJU36_02775 [Phycisphaeraceae bacterium]|nr:hypothetical protein [Phycisphaeraceae bacterium]
MSQDRPLHESVEGLSVSPMGPVYPSPESWLDQVLYFLLPDRFSDGDEHHRPLFNPLRPEDHRHPDLGKWRESGRRFVGGRIRGITTKLDYLKELGVTTLWVGPVWKQRADLDTYHGYGIQNFLMVDPRFGSLEDLQEMVRQAHQRGMYVLLDVIYNHTGNNWYYLLDDEHRTTAPYREEPAYPFGGWRSGEDGAPIDSIKTWEDGVWPREFQNPDWYTRAGTIGNWDAPGRELDPDAEFRRGDFGDLKNLNLADDAVVDALVRCYQYWLAVTDCDGFRIDTVKHVPHEVSARFCHGIRDYARQIGKENFLLLGEVTGSPAIVRAYVDPEGANLDAALDIESAPRRLSDMVKGFGSSEEFFNHFGGRDDMGPLRKAGIHHVSILDDHDMVWRDGKHRFIWANGGADGWGQLAHSVGVQLGTPGIPCIYYGTEQAFDGSESSHDEESEPRGEDGRIPFADRYVRECMFGGEFGAFQTRGCHFFNREHPVYRRINTIAHIRTRNDAIGQALRRGELYVREVRHDGEEEYTPYHIGGVVAWSRLSPEAAVVCVFNSHGLESRVAEVTVDKDAFGDSGRAWVHYRGDWSDEWLRSPPRDQTIEAVRHESGRVTVKLELPPSGMAILSSIPPD